MPTAALKACAVPGCANVCEPGISRCEEHKGNARPRIKAQSHRLYGTAAWDRMRKRVLREEPWCRKCTVNASEHVDHIVELEDGGARLARENLQGLCARCHGSKTQRSAQVRRRRRDGVG